MNKIKEKHPRFNGKELDEINQNRFVRFKKIIYDSLVFDNSENDLGLSEGDIELLSHNSAYMILVSYEQKL